MPDHSRARYPHLKDFPHAVDAAKGYLEELAAAGVPFVLNPDWDEDTDQPRGFDVGVDIVGDDGFAHWIVMNFREDQLHGEGYTVRRSLPGPTFEHASLSPKEMASGLALCRAGRAFPAFAHRGTFKILEFILRL